MLSELNHGGRISQRGDTVPVEDLWCAIPQVGDLAVGRSCVSHGARRCDKVGDITVRESAHRRRGSRDGREEYLVARRAARRGDRMTRAGYRAT